MCIRDRSLLRAVFTPAGRAVTGYMVCAAAEHAAVDCQRAVAVNFGRGAAETEEVDLSLIHI